MKQASFVFSGISDEAGKSLDVQIRAHKELGWKHVELRMVDGVQFTDLTEAAFDKACGQLQDAGIAVSSFASGIANWACKITDPFEKSTETLKRSIARMNRLGTRFIRVMSWPNDGRPEAEWSGEAVRRMKELGRMAQDGGIVIVVENCDGWASTSAAHYRGFFEAVGSPAVKAVYDTGNPAAHGHTNTLEWYELAKPFIAYIHIKANTGPREGAKAEHCWPEEGSSKVRETLQDLKNSGFNGFVSIEPHLKAVIHEGKGISEADAAYQTYVEYGRRVMAMCKGLR